MLPKIKKFCKKNKKLIGIGVFFLLILIVFLVLFKSLFYSDSEKATYGVRIRDMKDNKITKEEIKTLEDKTSTIGGVKNARVEVKGRLIKVFVQFDEGVSNDNIKGSFNSAVSYLSDKVKGYYDITLYAERITDGKVTYPVIGYKHKSNPEISFDVL